MGFKKNIIIGISVLCVIFLWFSCHKDKLLIDLSGEPDKVIENTSGTLSYSKEFKSWKVINPIPGTHDSIDVYLIVEMHDRKFPFEEGKQVLVSGLCYSIPYSILVDKGIEYPAGVECYYIKVTDLK